MTSRTRRTCIGCRRRAHPDQLVRVVRGAGGTLDEGRALPGRGAWLCRDDPACGQLARRRGAFQRALRETVPQQEIDALLVRLYER
ncbi:MAG: YlxR family protein [Actinomycetota bacterium]|nr:YlxR family protein [Actinomycetota bacterium]